MKSETPRTDAVCDEIADLADTLRAAGCSSLSLQQFQILIRKQLEKLRDHARKIELELAEAKLPTVEHVQAIYEISKLKSERAAALPNDQKLSHGQKKPPPTCDRSANSKAHTPLAPALC